MQRHYDCNRLSPKHIAFFTSIRGWRWAARASNAGSTDGVAAGASAKVKLEPREAEPSIAKAASVEEAKPQNTGNVEQWIRQTQRHLTQQLARLRPTDIGGRRNLLRAWQLEYHPDKNPGRSDEVMPLFRWVQSLWDRQFRPVKTEVFAEVASNRAASAASSSFSFSGAREPQQPTAEPKTCTSGRPTERGPVQADSATSVRRRIVGKRPPPWKVKTEVRGCTANVIEISESEIEC